MAFIKGEPQIRFKETRKGWAWEVVADNGKIVAVSPTSFLKKQTAINSFMSARLLIKKSWTEHFVFM
jgi:hypothetical protein